jgi:hypothetical protein
MFMREFLVEVKVFNMGERHLPRIGAEKTDVFFLKKLRIVLTAYDAR